MTQTTERADASPTKAFFVRMITRDISLEDCIMDLIDNSIDGAWRREGHRPMGLEQDVDLSPYGIEIAMSPERFSIIDDCGGMSLDDAAHHAFSFGRRASDRHDDYSIGVYGTGMKRAVFKLGTQIKVRSAHRDGGRDEAFVVPIDVDAWLENDAPPWDFDLVTDDMPLPKDGVEVTVESLTDGAAQAFSNPAFIQNLRRMIGRDYTLHLSRGLRISVNGSPVVGLAIELRESPEISPVRLAYEDAVGGLAVNVEIIAGMAAAPPDTSDPDEGDDGDRRFGWYVVCNGRIVVAADKTSLSGWGTDFWPQWHSQYSGFIGVVLFTAASAVALPLTTTKRSVDTTSELYRRARPKMREATRRWIDYTNARKQAIDEARRIETAALRVSLQSVAVQPTVRLPSFTARPAPEPIANVNYVVPLQQF